MWWSRIVNWFSELGERKRCIEEFNIAAKNAFIENIAPVFLKAEVSRGNRNYRHSMSNFFYSGFKIKTVSGRYLSSTEIEGVGKTINSNGELMRRLVTLGFDTLEICDTNGTIVKDWRLTTLIELGR